MNDDVDYSGYCERVGPGLLDEPLNAVTNLAFLIAAVAVWFLLRVAVREVAAAESAIARADGTPAPAGGRPVAGTAGRWPVSLLVLVGLMVAIGLGSLAFHTVAGWTVVLDVVPIALFMVFAFVCALHLFWGLRWPLAWIGAPAFLAFAALVGVVASALDLPPGNYVAALLLLIAVAATLGWSRDRGRRAYSGQFGLAAGLFAISLTLRTIDDSVCSAMPIGTHFLWHLFNAAVLYVVARAEVLRWRELSLSRAG